ncbi:MAG: hypothetical protein ABIB43_02950 [archaeon]
MEKINKILGKLSFEELKELKETLQKGEAIEAIEESLERFKNSNKVCPVCNTPVGDEGFVLIFGPNGFKKKATFDGTDCLEYFIYNMRK